MEWFKKYLKESADDTFVKILKSGIADASIKLYWEEGTGGLSIATPAGMNNCRFETWEMRNKGKKPGGGQETPSWKKFNIHKANALLGDIVSCNSSDWSWDPGAAEPATGRVADSEWKKRAKEIFFGNEMVLTGQMAADGGTSWACKTFLDALMKLQAFALDQEAH